MTFPTYLTLGATGGMDQALDGRLSKRGASLRIGRVVSTNLGSAFLLVRAAAKAVRGHWTRAA